MLPRPIRDPVLALLGRLGCVLTKINREGARYGAILTGASYSPWNAGAEFKTALCKTGGQHADTFEAAVGGLLHEQRALPDRLTLYNLNGHAVVVKTG